MSVQAKWEGADEFIAFLRNAERQYSQTSDLMRRIAGYMESQAVRRIKEGDLKASNSAVTRDVKGSSEPLQDRGQFLQGVRGNAKWGKTYATVGSNARQAAILQTGGTIEAKQAEKLAFPAGKQTRALQDRYGFDYEALISGMREDGYDVWFLDNAVMARKPGSDNMFVLLVRKESVKIPAYQPFRLEDEDREGIKGIVRVWLQDVRPKGRTGPRS